MGSVERQTGEKHVSSDDSYFDDSDFSDIDEKQFLAQRQLQDAPKVGENMLLNDTHDEDSAARSGTPHDKILDSVDPAEIVESLMPPGYSISSPPPSIASISSMSSAPTVLAHLNAIQTISLDQVSAITKDDPEYVLLLNSVSLIIAVEHEKNRIFGTILQVYGKLFPELAEISHEKDEYIHVAGACGTTFLREPLTEDEYDKQNKIIERLTKIVPSQQAAVLIALASVTKGVGSCSEDVLRNIDSFLQSASEEIILLEEIKQIFLDHLSQRIHLYLPNISNLVGPSIAAQLFGVVDGKVDKIMMMTREDVMNLGSPYQDTKQTSEDLTGLPTGYIANADLVLFAKENPLMDAYTVQKVVKAVASKIVLAARVDIGRYAPDGEKGFLMKKAVIRRINRLEKDISDKERKRVQNFENRQRLMDDIRAHREEMRLNQQVYGKESTVDSHRAFELWKNARQQELAEYNATLYSHNRGRMTAKQHGRHQQLVAVTAAARASGMTVSEYEEQQREIEKSAKSKSKKGFRRISERS
ncbi:trans-splicing factor [Perkinsela sp. CCAP 1560/4]|nr:trans-splicing factor [Perkinsela sp. CCAP 1560/4]|eukprot:KNH09722.1 trans-splicing factor [Perkinsela sp. CCAP 1560/4]